MSDFAEIYEKIRRGEIGFYEQKRGLIAVSGGEAKQFLNGLVTNDVAKMNLCSWMSAAFPNAQGRLLALARIMRFNCALEKEFFRDDKFVFETEAATYEKVLQNLSRFTMAGDFKVEDLTEKYTSFSLIGDAFTKVPYTPYTKKPVTVAGDLDPESAFFINGLRGEGYDFFMPKEKREDFVRKWTKQGGVELSGELYEILRIEKGIPKYGVDMDETTIVPELDLPDLISYDKGCYIGQEIIARIHFRGHVAKKLMRLIFWDFPHDEDLQKLIGAELVSEDGKNAGRVTSTVINPVRKGVVALGYVRYEHATDEKNVYLKAGDYRCLVTNFSTII